MSNFILFLPTNSREVKKISAEPYEKEEILQDLIENHPELLPLSFGRIITLAREYPIASGSIDLLCIDNESKIYIIETKLRKNSDRRQAIAQLIDYAAQLSKESFETFQEKIAQIRGISLENLLKEFEEGTSLDLEDVKRSLREKNFVLILVMDSIEPSLRDMISYLRLDNGMNIFGIELQMHSIKDQGKVFVPEIIPPVEKTPTPRKSIITKEEAIRNYKNKGLETEINIILEAFRKAKEKWPSLVQEKPTPKYFDLVINQQITLSVKKNPTEDHGVWVNNPTLYEKVYNIGQKLGMQVKMSEKPLAKIIIFNGTEGIKKLSKVIDELIQDLINISTQQ